MRKVAGIVRRVGSRPADDRELNDFARTQRGLVTTADLKQRGYGEDDRRGLRRRGTLQRVFPEYGVYLVGGAVFDQAAARQAGVLANGPKSSLLRHTAAESRLLLPERVGHVTVGRPGEAPPTAIRSLIGMPDGRPALMTVREVKLKDHERDEVDGVATPSIGRTLLDVAGYERHHFGRAWREADFLDLIDVEAMRRSLGRGRRGASVLRDALELYEDVERGDHGVDSPDELAAIRAVLAAGVPPPLVNHWMQVAGEWKRLDLYWAFARLCIEVDGWRGHRTPTALERDHARDDDLLDLGILTMRYTARQMRRHPEHCAKRILKQLALRAHLGPI